MIVTYQIAKSCVSKTKLQTRYDPHKIIDRNKAKLYINKIMQVTIIGVLIVTNISTNNDIESFRPIDYIITSALRMVYIEYAYI